MKREREEREKKEKKETRTKKPLKECTYPRDRHNPSDDRFPRSGRLIYLSADKKKHLRPPCLIITERTEDYSTTPSSCFHHPTHAISTRRNNGAMAPIWKSPECTLEHSCTAFRRERLRGNLNWKLHVKISHCVPSSRRRRVVCSRVSRSATRDAAELKDNASAFWRRGELASDPQEREHAAVSESRGLTACPGKLIADHNEWP